MICCWSQAMFRLSVSSSLPAHCRRSRQPLKIPPNATGVATCRFERVRSTGHLQFNVKKKKKRREQTNSTHVMMRVGGACAPTGRVG